MIHERLPGVPRLCEICFSPIMAGKFHVNYAWPGAFGLPVYVCTGDCFHAALKRLDAAAKRKRS